MEARENSGPLKCKVYALLYQRPFKESHDPLHSTPDHSLKWSELNIDHAVRSPLCRRAQPMLPTIFPLMLALLCLLPVLCAGQTAIPTVSCETHGDCTSIRAQDAARGHLNGPGAILCERGICVPLNLNAPCKRPNDCGWHRSCHNGRCAVGGLGAATRPTVLPNSPATRPEDDVCVESRALRAAVETSAASATRASSDSVGLACASWGWRGRNGAATTVTAPACCAASYTRLARTANPVGTRVRMRRGQRQVRPRSRWCRLQRSARMRIWALVLFRFLQARYMQVGARGI